MKSNYVPTSSIIFGIVGITVGFLATWLFVTPAKLNNNNTQDSSIGSQMGMMSNGQLDAHFIEQMIPHHEDAITMAKLAQTKALKPEVKQLALSIIDSQGKEIDQMKSWYKDWFGKEVPEGAPGMMGGNGGMHGGMMGDSSDMTKLETATDFDKAFVEEMIPHHQMAVMMATMLKNGTNRPEMKKLAEDIIAAQTSEIDQMRQWLKDWRI